MNWTTAIGLVGTLAGVVLTVIFYLRSRRYKRLTLTFTQGKLLSKTHPQVQILFAGNPVENLWRLRAVCWNSGTQEVRWSDIPSGRDPQLVFENARVLSVAHAGGSNSTDFAETNDDRSVSLKFAYLNPKDCGFFEVLYENVGANKPSFKFLAPVIGGRSADTRLFSGMPTATARIVVPATLISFLLITCLLVAPVLNSFVRTTAGLQVTILGLGLLILLLFGIVFWVSMVLLFLGTLHRSRVPELAKKFLSGAA